MIPAVEAVYGQPRNSRIKAIDVQGNQRIDGDAIRGRMTLRVGDVYSPESIRDQIQLVYEMGFFEDVQIETEPVLGGTAVVVVVREKPFITEIVFDGNEEISSGRLQEKLTVQSQSFLDNQLVKESADKIEQAYQEKAYYNAQVIPIIKSLGGDRKRLTFFIKEGNVTKIEEVNFVGATVVDRKELLSQLANREKVFVMSWFTDAGILKSEELPNDVERIREVYMNRGYLNVQVSQPTIDLTEDGDGLVLTYHIVEDEPYTFGRVAYRGNVVFEEAELRLGSPIVEGEVFQRTWLRAEVTRVTDLYGARGYSFADVTPSLETDPERKTATVTVIINEGKLMRIRRINITGNDKTRDNVIRRELRVEEQQVIDTVAMKRSFQRLNNLNFFETVEILPNQVDDDEVDLDVKVKEKPTGSFSVGGGFSTLDQLTAIANITEGNLFGRGFMLRLRGQLGQRRILGLLTFRDPHFRDSETSLQLDAFSTDTDFQTYTENKIGGGLTAGRFFSEFVSGSVSFFGEDLEIKDIESTASSFIRNQDGKQSSTGFRGTISRDTRDLIVDPRTGYRHSVNGAFATKLLGGSNYYYKVQLDSLRYTPLWWDTRWMIRGRFGIVDGINENPTPLSQVFFVGGINTMRGFEFGRAGPTTSIGDPEGAERQIVINNDFIFPIVPEAKLNGVLFFDYGEGFNGESVNLLDLRSAVGVEARWLSPFGPLRAAWGFNMDPREGEKQSVFEFSVGSLF